jgi:hypothetical protein
MGMRITGFAIGFILSATAWAQDSKEAGTQELGVHLRRSFIGGDVTSDGDSWHDFFSDSVGIGVHYSLFWKSSPGFELGRYLGFSFDNFGGKSETVIDQPSGIAVQLKPDTLTLTRYMLGFACRVKAGSVLIEPRLGIGMALYSGVDAETRAGNSTDEVSAIDPSSELAFELGVRGSLALSPRLALAVGLAYERNGAPNVASDLEGDISRFKDQENVVLDVGLRYLF